MSQKHSNLILLLSPQIKNSLPKQLYYTLCQSLHISIETAEQKSQFLAYLRNTSSLQHQQIFCLIVTKSEFQHWRSELEAILTEGANLLRRQYGVPMHHDSRRQTAAVSSSSFFQTIVILDRSLSEIRVHSDSNRIEISHMEAISTAVNLAYTEFQMALQQLNQQKRLNRRTPAPLPSHAPQHHHLPKRAQRSKSMALGSTDLWKTNGTNGAHSVRRTTHYANSRVTALSTSGQQPPPRKVTPPPPPKHLAAAKRQKHQQEMNLLDFSEPETPESVHDFFSAPQHSHSTSNRPQKPSRSKSSVNFDEIFASFAEHRHEAHQQHQNAKSTGNLFHQRVESGQNRTRPFVSHQETGQSNPSNSQNGSFNSSFSRGSSSNSSSSYNTPPRYSSANTNSSAAPNSPATSSSSTISPSSPAPPYSSNSTKRRSINYPRKSDLELMKTIHRAQNSHSPPKHTQIGKSNPQSPTPAAPSAATAPPPRKHPETFEINESEILDFDFGGEDSIPDEGLPERTESFEDLTRELDEMLEQIGVSNGTEQPQKSQAARTASASLLDKHIKSEQRQSTLSPALTLDQKLGRIIHEIYHEEDTFVNSLKVLQETFIVPLKQRKLISDSVHHLVFSDFPVIYNIHAPMVQHMKKLFDSTGSDPNNSHPEYSEAFIGKFLGIIKSKAPAFKLYTRYFSQMTNMMNALKEEQEKNEEFREFLSVAQQKLRDEGAIRQNLTSYLQQILQHLARYPLILNRLNESAPPSVSYRSELGSLIDQIKATLRHCNQRKTDEDMQELTALLEKELGMNIVKRGRRLIKHGELTRKKPTKRYSVHLYLFNDLIIMKDLRKGMKHQPPKVLKIHHNLRIGRLNAVSFFIFDCYYQRHQALTLFFETEDKKQADEWVGVSNSIVKNRKKLIKSKLKESKDDGSEMNE